jgi:hypothetical protein
MGEEIVPPGVEPDERVQFGTVGATAQDGRPMNAARVASDVRVNS